MATSRLLLTAIAVMSMAGIGGGAAVAADVQHGISLTKACASPTNIGQPYVYSYAICNTLDEARDTRTIYSLVDNVHPAGSDASSGNVLSPVQLTIGAFLPGFGTPPSCTGPA